MKARIPTPLDRVLREQGRRARWLADLLEVDESQVSRWRYGLHEPSDETKAKIAAALGRQIDELWPAHSGESPERAAA